MGNLSSTQFMHYSDHEFNPGDEVKPPTETGHESEYEGNEHYRPDRVYMLGAKDALADAGSHHYGTHAYAVEPVGKVERDPEAVHLEHVYKGYGLADDSLDMERVRNQFAAPRARVVKRVASDNLFRGK